MIKGKEIYQVLAALVPLYVPMILAYGSVRWWKIFTPDQCSGINRFVALFAVPLLSFHVISSNDPSAMNLAFLAADTLQKVVILGALILWNTFTKWGSLDWTLTLFSLSTLPNTLIVGVPLLTAMYGDSSATLMTQTVVMQGVIWIPLVLFLYEYRGAKHRTLEKFPKTKEPLQTDSEMKENGELVHVVVRSPSFNESSKEPMQKTSSFKTIDNIQISGAEEEMLKMQKEKFCRSRSYDDHLNRVQHELIEMSPSSKAIRDNEVGIVDGIKHPLGEKHKEGNFDGDANKRQQIKHASVFTKLHILTTCGRNLMTNPNTYASIFGITWSLISFRWNIKLPSIIDGSITILSNTGLGMAMFSLGLFMASQPKIIACGKTWSAISMLARFLVGPAVMASTSIAMGIRGVPLHVSIVQAALPQAVVTFVFAKEYDLHADILSTAVIFGMMVSLPTTIMYYVLLGL
ncbi:hypothetical protein VNO77_42655 [Canavalia gladiata]|uniref:Auxin efflux carrier component n=1 Tax=Canavalia gladiata TaxID=3824 RepID=A0AAN9JV44_CANGL